MDNLYYAEYETDKFIRDTYFPDFSYKGTMVEVGGGTPLYLSMSRHFKLNGWRCIVIEPNPKLAEMHRQIGNEICEAACSKEDKNDVNFQIVHFSNDYDSEVITDHSFSSLAIKNEYLNRANIKIDKLPIKNIKVKTKKLNTIFEELQLEYVDFISIDVEGWELEVLGGFDLQKYKPKVVLLENWVSNPLYESYMNKFGYKLDHCIQYNHIYIIN